MAEDQGKGGPTITCAENGPYIVAGLEQLTGSDGAAVAVKDKIAYQVYAWIALHGLPSRAVHVRDWAISSKHAGRTSWASA